MAEISKIKVNDEIYDIKDSTAREAAEGKLNTQQGEENAGKYLYVDESGNIGLTDEGGSGADGVSVTHAWDGTTLIVTSASGTTSADLKGEKGDTGPQGEVGPRGEQGIQGEVGPTGPQGEQGETGPQGLQGIQGEQGEKGDKGDKGDTGKTGPAGADGKTPEKGVDYFTEADKTEMVEAVKASLTAGDVGAAETNHTQAASTISAGTFGGQVVANSSGQTPDTSLLRNSKLVTTDTNPTVNGEIVWLLK